jgi:hypothetical protein
MASHDPKAVEKFRKVYNMRDGNFVESYPLTGERSSE